ncbi:hypothetical protein SUGI_1057160 [Cryptomeria japonica]|uniref:uncharacterized protein LOC131060773 isoform X1 n=1 Tax=Cryptomeria japonica TaxID=3369 RepID=UPI002414CD76|nr:uncharacterized protein LOC131060773 isoform X1 [Cryptomeria japonica]GLJ49779.1 hypothetical protein SUGI_1057160 [Cryptomeria japonica]
MGKNQAYKAMQRAKMATAGGPDEIEDGMMDGSFHSPEWHAARLASLQTSHTVTWDEFNRRQKEAERKKGELEADEASKMREYRAQLDAERASKLARGRNHAGKRPSSDKGKKDKEKDGRNSKRKKHSRKRHRNSSSDSDLDSSSSDDERHPSRRERSKSKRSKKERKRKSRQRQSRSSSDDSSDESKEYGPVPLSSFFDKQ